MKWANLLYPGEAERDWKEEKLWVKEIKGRKNYEKIYFYKCHSHGKYS